MRDDLRTYILADETVSGLIGTRMYPGSLDQDCDRPAAVIHVISRGHATSLAGIVEAGEARVQIDVYGSTRLTADAAAAAIVARLKTLSGTCPASIGDGTAIADVDVEGPRDDTEHPDDGSADWEYIAIVEAVLTIG